MSEEKTAIERLAERKRALEVKDAEADALLAEQAAEQELKDLEAFEALEGSIGRGKVAKVFAPHFEPGLPTFIVVRCPESKYYKRYTDMVRRAGQDLVKRGEATDMLADVCIVYPDVKELPAFKTAFGSTLAAAFVAAIALSDLQSGEEKKA